MSKVLETIKAEARRLGACTSVDLEGIKTEAELIALLFTPQGREFCIRHSFPALEQIKELEPSPMVVVGDSPEWFELVGYIALVGGVHEVLISDPTRLHKVVAMHGADVDLNVQANCVVVVARVGEGVQISYTKEEGASLTLE